MPTTILLVEDEEPIRRLVSAYMSREGYRVIEAADGLQGWQLFQAERPPLAILDLMLPGLDGLELCRRIRSISDAYVIILTARAEETERIIGLEVGADDYVTKPFSPRELVARVRAAIRRLNVSATDTSSSDTDLPSGDPGASVNLTIDRSGRRVYVSDNEVALTTLEFDLLDTFSRHPNMVLSREQLIRQVWGYDFPGEERLVDVHVAQLRKKLGASGRAWIQTVRGVGYRFDPQATP